MVPMIILGYDDCGELTELEGLIRLLNLELENPEAIRIMGVGYSLLESDNMLLTEIIIPFVSTFFVTSIELIKCRSYVIIKFHKG